MRHTKGLNHVFYRRLMHQYPPDWLQTVFVFNENAEITVERDDDGIPLRRAVIGVDRPLHDYWTRNLQPPLTPLSVSRTLQADLPDFQLSPPAIPGGPHRSIL